MFTGLIQDVGTVKSVKRISEGMEISIQTKLASQISIDDSIATSGVCLTATKVQANIFWAQMIPATLEKTSLKNLKVGQKVNLELALKLGDNLGGHIVQGHVNGQGKVLKVEKTKEHLLITIDAFDLSKYMVDEGSVALDGISLTVSKAWESKFQVSIIPHTYKHTTVQFLKPGDLVNIEVDMFAKYIEKLMEKLLPRLVKS